MKLIIDISEALYAKVPTLLNKGSIWIGDVLDAVKNGTPLETQSTDKCKGCYYNDGEAHAECVVCDKKAQPTDEDCISRSELLRHQHIIYDDDGEGYRAVYVKDIKAMPSVTPRTNLAETSQDCIGREEAKRFLYERIDRLNDDELYDIFSRIIDDMYNELPSVTLERPKGKWIDVNGDKSLFECSKCGDMVCCANNNYCPNCGAEMEDEL